MPWLRLLDAVLGITNTALARRGRTETRDEPRGHAAETRLGRALEAHLAGVVVAALKEAFDRDTRRLELEREQIESERQRAERALRLELLRQAADREVGRLRLLAGLAAATWVGTLFFSARLVGGPVPARVALGTGWVLLLAALALAFVAQSRVGDRLARLDETSARGTRIDAGAAGALASWLVVIGLALVCLAVLLA